MIRAVLIAIISLSSLVASASAQSVFSTRSFGVPLSALDARSQALGGIGIGILGASPALINPAELSNFAFRGAVVSMQSSTRELRLDGARADIESSRFPLLRIIYPLSEKVSIGVGYGGFLDQSWAVEVDRREVIGGDSVTIHDRVSADGGIGQLRLGLSYAVTPTLAIGIDGGLYSGSLEDRLTREFGEGAPAGIGRVEKRYNWTQRAPLASVGVRWDPVPLARLSASLTWAGELSRFERDSEAGEERELATEKFQLPLQIAAGASAYFIPGLLGTISARWAGWGSAADAFAPEFAPADTWEYGAGIEWGRISIGEVGLPIRFGYHRMELPFRYEGVTPTESAATFGLGLQLARTNFGPLASIDAAIERGRQSAPGTGLSEAYWRFTLGMGVFGR